MSSAAVDELEAALAYYDKNASESRAFYYVLRVGTILLAAAIPVVAAVDGSPVITAVLGSVIVVAEGLQQLFQFHNRWVDYRKTWNALERERRWYQSGGAHYAAGADVDRVLAERMEIIIESENADWALSTAATTPSSTNPA